MNQTKGTGSWREEAGERKHVRKAPDELALGLIRPLWPIVWMKP